MLSEMSQSDNVGFCLYELPREAKCTETEWGSYCQWSREEGIRSRYLVGTEFQFGMMNSSGDGW